MQPRIVKKLPGLSVTIDFQMQNGKFNTLIVGFQGPKDAVRIAARDAVYGLRITQADKSTRSWQHVKTNDEAEINIAIDIRNQTKLMTLFRYCKQLGIESFAFKRPADTYEHLKYYSHALKDLCLYLDNLQDIANKNTLPLEIPAYPKPFNRNFWTSTELEEDMRKRHHYLRSPLFSNEKPEDRLSFIQRRLSNIIDLVSIMIESHPSYDVDRLFFIYINYQQSASLSKWHAKNYLDCFTPHPIGPVDNYAAEFAERFPFITTNDAKNFCLLAAKYMSLLAEKRSMDLSQQEGLSMQYRMQQR